jgi:hypothetical protein
MDEAAGLPTQLTGFQSQDADLEVQRLDSILATGIDPRIKYKTRIIPCIGRTTLVIRVERSWNGPHRVIFKGSDKFFGRNSAGKYPLDVSELRSAFTLSSTVIERIRAFRVDRIIALSNNDTPVPFEDGPKIILHCIPIEAFGGKSQYDMLQVNQNSQRLRPMVATSYSYRLNLEGIIAYGAASPTFAYTQLYRTGVIEAVLGRMLVSEFNGRMIIASAGYERYIFDHLSVCFKLLQQIGAMVPVVVAVTLTGTRGVEMSVDRFRFGNVYPIKEDKLILPETIVEDFSMPVGKILQPIFDLVWNACGLDASLNFDANGGWVERR